MGRRVEPPGHRGDGRPLRRGRRQDKRAHASPYGPRCDPGRIPAWVGRGGCGVRFSIHPIQRNDRTTIETEAVVLGERKVRSSSGQVTLRIVIQTALEMLGEAADAAFRLSTDWVSRVTSARSAPSSSATESVTCCSCPASGAAASKKASAKRRGALEVERMKTEDGGRRLERMLLMRPRCIRLGRR